MGRNDIPGCSISWSVSDSPGKHKYKCQIWVLQIYTSHRRNSDGWTYHIYIIWERDQTDTDVNSTKIKERLIKMCQTEQLTKGVSHTCRKLEICYWLINQDTPRQCCSHTSWGYSNWKQMMSNSTEFNGSFDKEGVPQAVPMNPLAFTNMIMHRTTIADQKGHGYHWVLLFKLMVLRNWLHLKNAAAFSLLSI